MDGEGRRGDAQGGRPDPDVLYDGNLGGVYSDEDARVHGLAGGPALGRRRAGELRSESEMPSHIVGYRLWRLKPPVDAVGLRQPPGLLSLNRSGEWSPGTEMAVPCAYLSTEDIALQHRACYGGKTADEDGAAGRDVISMSLCSCGIHAWHSFEVMASEAAALSRALPDDTLVAGMIKSRGAAVVGTTGFRAAAAEVVAILDETRPMGFWTRMTAPWRVTLGRPPRTRSGAYQATTRFVSDTQERSAVALKMRAPSTEILLELEQFYGVPVIHRRDSLAYAALQGKLFPVLNHAPEVRP